MVVMAAASARMDSMSCKGGLRWFDVF